jgi:phage terminase large subunit-like protein
VCWRYHGHATKVALGQVADARLFSYVCAHDEGEDPFTNPACWAKTNPNLGTSIREDYLQGQVDEARSMPAKESVVRRLHFCEWVDAASPWISGAAWLACEREPRPLVDLFRGLDVVLAIDLSTTTDLSALAIAAETPDGLIRAAVDYWTPADNLRARAERDSVPYELWVKAGHLRTEEGATLTYAPIARRVAELAEVLNVTALVFDRYRMSYLRRELEEIGVGIPLIEHPQGWVKLKTAALWMPQSINELEKVVLQGRLEVQRNPVLTWNSASAVTLTDDQNSRIFSKRKSTGRIDGLVALAMAIGKLRSPELVVDVADWIA